MKAELVYVSAIWAKTDLVAVTLWTSPVIRTFHSSLLCVIWLESKFHSEKTVFT